MKLNCQCARWARIAIAAGTLITASCLNTGFADEGEPTKIDFENYEIGIEPDDLFVIEGTFKIGDDDGNKVLQLEPQPLSESGVIFGKSMKGAASITAEVKATKRRRSTPRFGIGLHGISGYRLRIVPATSEIEIVKSEERVKAAALKWKNDEWLQLKLAVEETAEGKWQVNGWAWPKGEDPPAEPVITLTAEGKPGQGKASVWGTPYSGTPILFDEIVIRKLPTAANGERDPSAKK